MTKNPLALAVKKAGADVSPFNVDNRRTLRDPKATSRKYKNKGRKFVDMAREFLDDFPIGRNLSPTQFDEWAISKGHLHATDPSSDCWPKHLSDRSRLRKRINLGGGSQHMPETESFQVEFTAHPTKNTEGTYTVRSTYDAYSVSASDLGDMVHGWVSGQLEELERLGNSTDMQYLGELEKIALFHVTTGLKSLDSTFAFHLDEHESRMRDVKKMIASIEDALPSKSKSNGGFAALNKLPE